MPKNTERKRQHLPSGFGLMFSPGFAIGGGGIGGRGGWVGITPGGTP